VKEHFKNITFEVQQVYVWNDIVYRSEVMFSFAFFWAFFHMLLPQPLNRMRLASLGIGVFNAFDVPFLNTCILSSSGATITRPCSFIN
jgi:heme/copper-type cytochrome/quinol oxidase subunit 3